MAEPKREQFPGENPQIVVVPGGGARYLPAYYNGQQILWRSPWTMPGEVILAGGVPNTFVQIPAGVLQQNADKPFEIHDFNASAAQSLAVAPFNPIAEPAPGIFHFWQMTLKALGLNEELTNNQIRASSLFNVGRTGTGNWPWYMPFVLDQTQGFQARFASELPANAMRISVNFRGYLLTLGNALQRGGQPG